MTGSSGMWSTTSRPLSRAARNIALLVFASGASATAKGTGSVEDAPRLVQVVAEAEEHEREPRAPGARTGSSARTPAHQQHLVQGALRQAEAAASAASRRAGPRVSRPPSTTPPSSSMRRLTA